MALARPSRPGSWRAVVGLAGRLAPALLLALASASGATQEPTQPPPAAQPSLDSVLLEATVEPGEPLMVSVDYFLHPLTAPAVEFTALELGGHRAVNVRAFAGERELSFRTSSNAGPKLEGRVDLPDLVAGRERFQLRLRYEVLPRPGGDDASHGLVLPVLVPAWAPLETAPGTFVATVRLPAELRVLDAFPSEFERLDSPAPSSSHTTYRFSLPVVPSLLRLRTGAEGASWLTLARGLDIAALVTLAALTLYGWRRVREHLP